MTSFPQLLGELSALSSPAKESPEPYAITRHLPELGFYCACLAAYNNGLLHGSWIDLELCEDLEDIQEAIDYVLKSSPEAGAEEYAVHDYAGLPNYLTESEWPNFSELLEYKDTLLDFEVQHHDKLARFAAFRLICEDRRATITCEQFQENYCGFYSDGAEFAQELASDTGSFNEGMKWPLDCIDWDMAFDALEMTSFRANGGLHVFLNF